MRKIQHKPRRKFLKDAAIISGAASLGMGALNAQTAAVATHEADSLLYPRHNDRAKGWLRFIWQKATTPDDWGYTPNTELP